MKFSHINPRFAQNRNLVSFGGLMDFPPAISFGGLMNFPPNNLKFHNSGGGDSFEDPMKCNLRSPMYGNVIVNGGLMNFPDNNLRLDHHGTEANFPPNAFTFLQYGTGVPYGGPMDFLPEDSYHDLKQRHSTSQSPPPPEVSAWDYFNPFTVIDDIFSSDYFEGRYESNFSSIDPNLREVREKEGIPDLEEESEQDLVEEEPTEIELEINNRDNTNVDLGDGSSEAVPLKEDSREGNSEAAPLKDGKDVLLAQEKETTGSHGVPAAQERDPESIVKDTESSSDKSSCLVGEENESRETVEMQEALKQEDASSIRVSSTTFDTHGSRDLMEVLTEIKDAFETAVDQGKDVSVALEAGKLQHQPRSAKLKAFSHRILSFVSPSVATSTSPMYVKLKRSAFGAANKDKAWNGNPEKEACVTSANLSSTLEKLYVWERKLYKEVKVEERLRGIYDKEWKKLKELDDKGAESSKIDATHDSIKKLLPKIKVSVSTVDAISRRIHKLRDEELQSQLNALIHRFMGMWKFMVKCHQKQLKATLEARTHVQLAKASTERNSSIEATQRLEMEILNWAAGFSDWVNTQKAFVKFLNGCLMKCLIQEPEETPDGIAPFSPTRLGAPSIFITCNDWQRAIENVPETEVSKAMHDFASTLHQLHEKLDEERHQRLKVEYLSKLLEKRVKSLCRERGINLDSEGTTEGGIVHADLDSMKNRLDEEKTRHEEAIKQVNDAASQGLRAGLIRVFKALDIFSLAMLKSYEQVRIPNGE
ncbi:protein ALTERED PHOSPHATE STARVATION RESPONSE 1-like [Actinidia eriantha]|uniref:protein ALTERED PHOSPHATE STARVATION RESPONSE 1-like n=1 Tax=Actinidia eriantha TaxID=165200 RepID=UPI0025839149|nr:protein ALTERED PHOSPHATE STARVATION RESPONSE 1-like [Actinidia eriantha]XP_057492397.1 protein ALTERED PHOSPHATE STARVATION RESPONSE 1-like [Actinidia eriantha]